VHCLHRRWEGAAFPALGKGSIHEVAITFSENNVWVLYSTHLLYGSCLNIARGNQNDFCYTYGILSLASEAFLLVDLNQQEKRRYSFGVAIVTTHMTFPQHSNMTKYNFQCVTDCETLKFYIPLLEPYPCAVVYKSLKVRRIHRVS